MAESWSSTISGLRGVLTSAEALLPPPATGGFGTPWHGGSAEFTVSALVQAMAQASEDLQARVAGLIEQAASGMVADHKAQMPRSGRPHRPEDDPTPLADRVYTREYNPLLRVVYNNAPHLHLIELGTRERQAKRWRGQRMKTPAFRGHVTASYSAGRTTFVSLAESRRATLLTAAEAAIGNREI